MIINEFVVFGKPEKINPYRKFRVLTWLEIHAFYLKSSRIIALRENHMIVQQLAEKVS
jgi:hypothetical protein